VRVLIDDGDTIAGDEQIIALDAHPAIENRVFEPFAYRGQARCGELGNIPVQRRQRGGTDGCAMYWRVIAHLGQLEHITSGQTEVLQRRAGDSATDIRFDD
jgi:hypothetical protein